MKILYVTDLHGDKKKYRKILDVAIEKEIKVIVNGGDMLPKQCDRHSEQSFFINGFLDEYFEELKRQDITYLAMLGMMIYWQQMKCLTIFATDLKMSAI